MGLKDVCVCVCVRRGGGQTLLIDTLVLSIYYKFFV